jgi:MoaD family protein
MFFPERNTQYAILKTLNAVHAGMTKMKLNIHYYAMFREAAGCSGESVETETASAVDLFDALKAKYDFTMCQSHVRLAVNDAFVDWDTPLNDGDSIVFIPPVAGG